MLKNVKFLTPEQLVALLRAARKHSTRDWAMILVAYRHALRASEVTGLTLFDYDAKTASLTIARLKGSLNSVQSVEKLKGQPLLDEPKALRLWLAERRDNSPFLFASRKGGRLTRQQFWSIVKRAGARAGIEGISAHTLKHTRVSLLLQGGATIVEAQRLAGHRSLRSTMWYVHTNDEQAAKAARMAEAKIF